MPISLRPNKTTHNTRIVAYHVGEASLTKAGEQLGDFLRSRRERLRLAEVGLSDTRRRRTPGLRREEVARLAGISAEWYVKLEQGRAVAPSSATIDALARAVRLSETEQAHLRALARGDIHEPWSREEVPATLRALVQSLDYPAYVTGLRWDMLVWNAAAAALFGALNDLAIEDRNILHYVLTDAGGRVLFGDAWADESRRMVALFRSTHDRHADDPGFVGLVEQIRGGCPEFTTWWDAHDVAAPLSGTKYLIHPARGRVGYDYATFQANDDVRLKLAVYLPL